MSAPWPNIVNFRDIGGYPGAGGRLVKTGLIYRGVSLNVATDKDLAAMAALGIGLVFDLRNDFEAEGRPDRLPPGATYVRYPAQKIDDDSPLELLHWEALIDAISTDPEALAQYEASYSQMYADMIKNPQAFAALLAQMLEHPARPVYIHCAAGKDRTGVACIIISRLLGVSRGDAFSDYMQSNDFPLPDVAGVRELARQKGVSPIIDLMTSTTKWQFDVAWQQPDKSWDGWPGFVHDGLGLADADVKALRAACLS